MDESNSSQVTAELRRAIGKRFISDLEVESLFGIPTKNSIAAARSSTTMPTCSIRWIAMCSMVTNLGSSRSEGRAGGDWAE
jgi:hypothetical protein